MSETDLSIVIVNYKTPDLTDICVGSIYKFTLGITYEVIIVDNDSRDDSETRLMAKYPQLKWVNMPENAGTSRAYNAGIRAASGKYMLILNSDTEFIDNAIGVSLDLYKEYERKGKTGLFSCQLKGYDDIIQFNSNISFPDISKYRKSSPFYIRKHPNEKSDSGINKLQLHLTEHESKWIGIAFGILNTDICKKEGHYFDEDIFMYSDEVEWCHRLIMHGYHHYFSPAATILHLNSGSSAFSEWRHGQITISEWLYMMKIHGKFYYLRCISQIWSNHFINGLFYIKQKMMGKLTEIDREAKKRRKFELRIMRRYFFTILFRYSSRPSSGKTFLKYTM